MCRNHVGMGDSFDEEELPALLKGRFSVKHIGAVCKGGIHFASGYLWCSVGLKHTSNQDYLQAVAGVLKTLRGPWIFAADFQNTPEELEASGWLKLVGGKIVAPAVPTCGKRIIDFFVVSLDLAEAVMGVKTVGDALCKPHRPVRLYLRARPRMMVVRTLKSLGTLEAEQPRGPAYKWEYDVGGAEELSLDAKYDMFTAGMENEIVSLTPMDEKQKEAMVGRSLGPQFVQKCALGDDVSAPRRTTATSRAWRRTVGWLDELASSVNVVVKLAAKHRLCTYQHPEPNKSKATQEQLEGFKKFLRWRTVVAELAEALPKHPSWVRALREAAEKNATR